MSPEPRHHRDDDTTPGRRRDHHRLGLMVATALEAAGELSKDGMDARVLDTHTVKPLDVDASERAARETGAIVTAEELC